MSIKKFALMAVLVVGVALVLSGCSGPNAQNSSNNDSSNTNTPSEIVSEVDEDKTVVYFFWGEGCPHCAKAKPWLQDLENEYSDLEVKMLETWNNQENAQVFQNMAQAYKTQARGVPTFFIGDFKPIAGFNDNIKSKIENKIKTCLDEGCINPQSKL